MALLRGARCLVFPSLFEGAGLPVAEALAAGCPVACSDLPPLREVADGAARFFDPSSASAIAEAATALWDDAGLRAELAARGRAKVASRRWTTLVPALRAAYARAVEVW
jgi:glycosyltransferase involved in cell wall biosynthesis